MTAKPDVAAVRRQNQQTQGHIKKTQEHIDKAAADEGKADDSLEAVKRDLEKLLRQ